MSEVDLESTTRLLSQIREGDMQARERLIERCLPLLRQWARGRIPPAQRDLNETDDLVQTALMRAINNLDSFQSQAPGALFAYLRQIALNLIRDGHRSSLNRPIREELGRSLADSSANVLNMAISSQTVEAYERGLTQLSDQQKNAVVLRMEFDFSYAEIASELALSSDDAARMLVKRGLVNLAQSMS